MSSVAARLNNLQGSTRVLAASGDGSVDQMWVEPIVLKKSKINRLARAQTSVKRPSISLVGTGIDLTACFNLSLALDFSGQLTVTRSPV